MNPLLIITVALYAGAIVLLLIEHFSPISWRYKKTEVSLPIEELKDLKDSVTPHSPPFLSVYSQLKIKLPEISKVVEYSCPTCSLVLQDEKALNDHFSVAQHGKPRDVKNPAFITKVGSPYDLVDQSPGAGVYRLVLKSGERIPSWAENERAIRVDVEGETLIYWVGFDGLRRIR